MSFFNSGRRNNDVERLFTSDPSVPVSTGAPPAPAGGYAPPPGAGEPGLAVLPGGFGSGAAPNTLDEPIWATVKRDLLRIYKNLVMVVFPFKDRSQQSAALRNWDLWGPMIFVLGLAISLSIGAATASKTFSLVFALVSVGAIVLTVNVVLLGGTIGFFQSLCLLGYCLFPMDVAAIVCVTVKLMLVRWIVVPIMVVWSSWASIPFIGGAVPANRRALAIYPLCLLYTAIGWLALITSSAAMQAVCSARPAAPVAARGPSSSSAFMAGRSIPRAPMRAASRPSPRQLTTKGLFGLGVPEVAVIAGVAALIFGPSKLPELGKGLGKTVKNFQSAAKEFEKELKDAVADEEQGQQKELKAGDKKDEPAAKQ
ncbi:YIPF6-like protein [Micractinium conductrix]|uniref:Protein YIP n=1 Tax=Micractinium conductrix TaxID=554055 RepID=A0A2P6VCZ4_9CHLO|nr:YIPF6-like protein [Micractinium conductrix]|eukprot:PSC71949.1 YIPF6-like protein [Micractinium conductrix]